MGVVERVLQDLCEVEVDIAAVGRLEHDLRSRGARVLGVEYTGEALLRFAVPPAARGVIDEIVAELTAGTATPKRDRPGVGGLGRPVVGHASRCTSDGQSRDQGFLR